MGNLASWFRSSRVDNDQKGPTSPRAMSDPELGRAGTNSLDNLPSDRVSMGHNTYRGIMSHSLLKKSLGSALSGYLSEDNTALEQLKALCAEQQKIINEYKERMESQEQTCVHKISAGHSVSDSNEAKQTIEEYERKQISMEQTIATLKSEKDDLLDRLSEIGAMKLKVGNPNITDLSDCNRPEKMCEQFSELYDNKWTDSYQLLTGNGKLKEKDVVCTLLHILQVIYDICLSKCQELDLQMNTALENFLGQDYSSEENEDFQAFKQRILHTTQDFRQHNCNFIPNIVKKDIKRKLQISIDKSLHKLCKDYIAECSWICWNMCIKNPPMYITSETDGLFNKDMYVPYTKAGPCVAYVVWPVVYLHKNGPIIKKGVAQGKKQKSTLTKEEDNKKDHTEDNASAEVKGQLKETNDSACDTKLINQEQPESIIIKRRNSDPLSDKRPQEYDTTKTKLKSKTLETPNKIKEKPSKIPIFIKADCNLRNKSMSNEV